MDGWSIIVSYHLRCRFKVNASFGNDPKLTQAAQDCKEKLWPASRRAHDKLPSPCHNLQLEDVADFGAMAESLPTHSSIRQCPTDTQVEVVGPGARGEAFLQCRLQHIHPKLSACGFHIRCGAVDVSIWHHLDTPHCWHLHNNAVQSLHQHHIKCCYQIMNPYLVAKAGNYKSSFRYNCSTYSRGWSREITVFCDK